MSKTHNHTFPEPVPIAIAVPDTAEQDGRYSEGSHNSSFELYVVHTLSPLKPTPL
jgi:hypothetical protein